MEASPGVTPDTDPGRESVDRSREGEWQRDDTAILSANQQPAVSDVQDGTGAAWRGRMHNGRVLTVAGSPFEQGRAQGAAVAQLINANLLQVERLVEEVDARIGGRYQEFLDANAAYAARVAPELLEECEGIAAGSGLALRQVLLLNLPLYVALRRSSLTEECSVLGVSRTRTSDGLTYLVKTRDQPQDQFQFEHLVLQREYPDGSHIAEVNAAGIVTNPGSGINGNGLALGTAGVWSVERLPVSASAIGSARAMPDTHTLLRFARSVADVVGMLRDTSSYPRLSGMNYVAADASGQVTAIECTAEATFVTPAERGVSCLTNHYINPDVAERGPSVRDNPSSYKRRARILELIDQQDHAIGFRNVLRITTDHGDEAGAAVCRHAVASHDSNTRYASIACVEPGEVWTLVGYPCEAASVAVL